MDIHALENCQVLNDDGKSVRLGDLWQEQPVALIFVRHFACAACRAQIESVMHHREILEKKNCAIYFIGPGSYQYIPLLRLVLDSPEAKIFADPTLESYSAAGLQRGYWASHRPASLLTLVDLVTKGYKNGFPGKETGDIWQLGGAIGLNPDGTVFLHYVSKSIGDLFKPSK